MTDAKVWFGTAMTNASGQWAVDYSAAGFLAPPAVQATCVGLGLTAADVRNADITSRTASAVSGKVVAPVVSVLGLITVSLVGAGVVVNVVAIGR